MVLAMVNIFILGFGKSKGLFDESINSITAFNYNITPELSYYGSKIRVKFNGICLKQDKTTYIHWKIATIIQHWKIVY